MTKSKVFICFSALISLVMSYVSTSDYFFYLPYPESFEMKSAILYQLGHVISLLKYMSATNLIIMAIFLLNSVSIILYLFKKDTGVAIKKYFSFGCILLINIGMILFFIDISCSTIYHEENYEHFPLKFIIFKWIPQVLEFSIPTFYLIGIQIYMMNRVKSVKLNTKTVILSIYISFIAFLTIITFSDFSPIFIKLLGRLKLKTLEPLLVMDGGSGPRYTSNANIEYYICYILAITAIFGAIYRVLELYSRKKNKKKQIEECSAFKSNSNSL